MSDELSSEGRRRSDMILQDAIAAGRRRALRRRVARMAAVVACIALPVSAWMLTRKTSVSPPPTIARQPDVAPPHVAEKSSRPLIVHIAADTSAAERYRIKVPTPSTVRRIDDDELLRNLASVGIRAGIATVGDTSSLVVAR